MEIKNISTPFYQSIVVIVFILTFDLLYVITRVFTVVSPSVPWLNSLAFLFIYSVCLSLSLIIAEDAEKKFGQSILYFIVTMIISAALAFLFSTGDTSIYAIYKAIFTAISFCFLALISIVSFIKKIVEYAENEEWDAPKPLKNRNFNDK